MDFLPYEGVPLAEGRDRKRLTLVATITAIILGAAGGLAALTPVSKTSSEGMTGEARTAAPSTVTASAPMFASSTVANIAASDSDTGPGSAESELALLSAAESKLALRPVAEGWWP